ncbi:MAG: HAD hydrolase-like protein [bacterium]
MIVVKRDPSFFQRILNIAGCLPHEAVMVGDRIDDDIVPANLSFQEPEGEEEEPI